MLELDKSIYCTAIFEATILHLVFQPEEFCVEVENN